MVPDDELSITQDIATKFLYISNCVLYTGISPGTVWLTFIHFSLDVAAERYINMNAKSRGFAKISTGINHWQNVIEVILFSAIITNSLFVYIASDLVKDFLNDVIGVHERNHLWVTIVIEHLLIAFLLVLKVFIDDVPRKFAKLKERVERILKQRLVEKLNQAADEKIKRKLDEVQFAIDNLSEKD